MAVLGQAWRRRLPWYPGDWVWPVMLFFVIAALGAAVAILSTTDASSSSGRTLVATTSVLSRAVTTAGLVPPEPTVTHATTPAQTTQARRPPRAGTILEWPRARSGWTVVLGSIPKPAGAKVALAQARKALGSGLASVGVLDSDRFSSLHPGYYVVFNGVYGSFSQANDQVPRAQSQGYPSAYARQIIP